MSDYGLRGLTATCVKFLKFFGILLYTIFTFLAASESEGSCKPIGLDVRKLYSIMLDNPTLTTASMHLPDFFTVNTVTIIYVETLEEFQDTFLLISVRKLKSQIIYQFLGDNR
jgi:hypothetical protein